MPIASVSRWKIDPEQASRIIHDAARCLKDQGASHVRIGQIHSGQHCGQTTIVVLYENFETYGRAMQKQKQDQQYQQHYQTALKAGELLDRTLITLEDVQ